MDIQTKDGILLRGIPDGTPDEVIKARLARIRAGNDGREPAGTQTAGWSPFVPSGQKGGVADVTTAEAIMGNPVTQFAVGAAEPILGAAQAAGVPIDAKAIQEMSEKGAQLYGGNWTRVPARLAGNMLSPAFLAIAKTLPAAATLGDLIKAGATMGAVGGATVLQDEPDLMQRGIGTALGAAGGAAIPPLLAAGKAVGSKARNALDLFSGEKGAGRIFDRYLQRIIGEKNIPVVASQLRAGGREPIPGYKPTAAEAVAGLPEGSPLIALQRITASQPEGISAQFGKRITDQKTAIAAAQTARDTALVKPLKDSLQRANQTGIQSSDIIAGIDDQLQKPGIRASDVVSKTLNAVKEKIQSITQNGVVDGEDLWTVRKELGNTIRMASKETANWDKRLTAGLERQIQKGMDDAIVKAGGTDWPSLMAEYAARSQAIQAVKDTAKQAMRPAQRTDLFGGLRIAEETRAHLPQLLSRPMMAANFVLRYVSSGIEPKVDAIATQRLLNPVQFAEALEKLTPQARNRAIEMMTKMGIAPAVQQAIKEAQGGAQPEPSQSPAPSSGSAGWIRG